MANDKKSAPHADAWDSTKGETFGGTQQILKLEIGEVSPPFRYLRTMQLPLKDDDGKTKMVDVPVAENLSDPEKKPYSMPIGAVFTKIWSEAKPQPGDEFLVKRTENATKKSGRGAGREFHTYALKITKRAPRAENAPQTA